MLLLTQSSVLVIIKMTNAPQGICSCKYEVRIYLLCNFKAFVSSSYFLPYRIADQLSNIFGIVIFIHAMFAALEICFFGFLTVVSKYKPFYMILFFSLRTNVKHFWEIHKLFIYYFAVLTPVARPSADASIELFMRLKCLPY